MQEIIVPTGESAKKVENFLKKKFPIGYVRKLFRRKALRINGQRGVPDDVVHPGDRIELAIPFERKRNDSAKPLGIPEIAIIYENTDLVVVNKPAGIAVHEARGLVKRETLLGVLETKYKGSGVRPRLVHRIDKDTSGTLLVAKSEAAAETLETLFETGDVEKEYLCLVVGRLAQSQGRIDFPLPGREGGIVPALTRFSVLERFSETTLLRVWIETGRMHQIRLHLAKLGHPVVLDAQHGDFAFNKKFRREFRLKRQFLHAAKIGLSHRGKRMRWSAPLAADLDRTLKQLGAGFKSAGG